MGKSKNRLLRLKHFDVRDDRCAMKVGTDALILGAWAELPPAGGRLLDVGTGSGILALMAAQRASSASIIAIELDPDAAQQARENADASPFSARLAVVEEDFLAYAAGQNAGTFDAVWLNPPYFRDKPASPDPARTRARHESSLPLKAWFPACARLLSEAGSLSVVWPKERETELLAAAAHAGFAPHRLLYLRGHANGPIIRLAAVLTRRSNPPCSVSEVSLETEIRKDGPPRRSAAYLALLADFVLEEGDPRRPA